MRTNEGPEHARAPKRAASAQAPPALPEMQDAPHTESQRTGRRRVLQASHVVVDEPIRGASPQSFVPFEVRTQEKAHFLRIAFIGASSAAAAFFFLMARRFIPFIAFAFLPPVRMFQV